MQKKNHIAGYNKCFIYNRYRINRLYSEHQHKTEYPPAGALMLMLEKIQHVKQYFALRFPLQFKLKDHIYLHNANKISFSLLFELHRAAMTV